METPITRREALRTALAATALAAAAPLLPEAAAAEVAGPFVTSPGLGSVILPSPTAALSFGYSRIFVKNNQPLPLIVDGWGVRFTQDQGTTVEYESDGEVWMPVRDGRAHV